MDHSQPSHYQVIMSMISELQSKADELLRSERAAALDQILSLMRGYNISVQDIRAGKLVTETSIIANKHRGQPAVAKFIHPITGKTWSGKGKQPGWLSQELAAGASLETFKVRR